jgi:hypothetical protein
VIQDGYTLAERQKYATAQSDLGRNQIKLFRKARVLGAVRLAVPAYQWYAESSRLEDVCGLAREAIGITTPAPDDTEAALKQVERPSAVNGYSLRELWRWQQLDGPQINDLCR